MNEELTRHMLSKQEERLNDHSRRLDKLEQDAAETRVKLDNLCDKIGGLTRAFYGMCGLLSTTMIGILVYGVQHILF